MVGHTSTSQPSGRDPTSPLDCEPTSNATAWDTHYESRPGQLPWLKRAASWQLRVCSWRNRHQQPQCRVNSTPRDLPFLSRPARVRSLSVIPQPFVVRGSFAYENPRRPGSAAGQHRAYRTRAGSVVLPMRPGELSDCLGPAAYVGLQILQTRGDDYRCYASAYGDDRQRAPVAISTRRRGAGRLRLGDHGAPQHHWSERQRRTGHTRVRGALVEVGSRVRHGLLCLCKLDRKLMLLDVGGRMRTAAATLQRKQRL
jgi:hypothetical protein